MSAMKAKRARWDSEVECEKLTQLMDLADPMLDFITEFLDRDSFNHFARTHPRFRRLCEKSMALRQIKTRIVDVSLAKLISLNLTRVRDLDLSNCWSDSGKVELLIKKCVGLTKLNIVNNCLVVAQLPGILDTLKNLEEVSVTTVTCGQDVTFGRYKNIRKIYIEFAPVHLHMILTAKFLKSCPGAKSLHMHLLDRYCVDTNRVKPYKLGTKLSNSYLTVLLSKSGRSICGRGFVVSKFFRGSKLEEHFLKKHTPNDDMWRYEEANADGGRSAPSSMLAESTHQYQTLHLSPDDRVLPYTYHAGHIGLRVHFPGIEFHMPSMEPFSSLVELNLLMCHIEYSAQCWMSLSASSPALEALAIPVCAFYPRSRVPPHNAEVPEETTESVLKAMTIPRLEKLHVEGRLSTPCGDVCSICEGAILHKTFLNYLKDSRSLEEVTLNDVNPCSNFFESVEGTFSMRTLRLNFYSSPAWEGFDHFLQLCKKLRYFKLRDPSLSLSTIALWKALLSIDLKQVCLSGTALIPYSERLIPEMEPSLIRFLHSVEVAHFHEVKPTSGEVSFYLYRKNVQDIRHLVCTADDPRCLSVRHAGRVLCSSECLIARVRPQSSKID